MKIQSELIGDYELSNRQDNVQRTLLNTIGSEAAVKGYVHVHVYRVRVTAMPSIDSSYKQAATHTMTFTAIDPQRADKKMYRITYEPLNANGEIDTTYAEGEVDYQ